MCTGSVDSMGCGDSRVVPPSLPRRGDNPNEEAVCFEHHDDERRGNLSGTDKVSELIFKLS